MKCLRWKILQPWTCLSRAIKCQKVPPTHPYVDTKTPHSIFVNSRIFKTSSDSLSGQEFESRETASEARVRVSAEWQERYNFLQASTSAELEELKAKHEQELLEIKVRAWDRVEAMQAGESEMLKSALSNQESHLRQEFQAQLEAQRASFEQMQATLEPAPRRVQRTIGTPKPIGSGLPHQRSRPAQQREQRGSSNSPKQSRAGPSAVKLAEMIAKRDANKRAGGGGPPLLPGVLKTRSGGSVTRSRTSRSGFRRDGLSSNGSSSCGTSRMTFSTVESWLTYTR